MTGAGRTRILGLSFGAALAVCAAADGRASTFRVGVGQGDSCIGFSAPAPVGPIAGNFTSSSNGFGSASAVAFAGGSGLGGSVLAASQGNQFNFSNQIGACFRAEAVYDDIIITSTTAAPGSPIRLRQGRPGVRPAGRIHRQLGRRQHRRQSLRRSGLGDPGPGGRLAPRPRHPGADRRLRPSGAVRPSASGTGAGPGHEIHNRS